MKNIIIIIICCCNLVSCLKEPKKIQVESSNSNQSKSFNNDSAIEPIKEKRDNSKILINDSIINVETTIKEEKIEHFENIIVEINDLFLNNSISGKSTFSIIDSDKKIILWGHHKFYLDDVYASYSKENDTGYGENYIEISCLEDSCIKDIITNGNVLSVSQAFKTKDDCLKFVELIKELQISFKNKQK